jgi:hypothetical protein
VTVRSCSDLFPAGIKWYIYIVLVGKDIAKICCDEGGEKIGEGKEDEGYDFGYHFVHGHGGI